MHRDPIHLSHVVPKLLMLAITLVVGFEIGARLSAGPASTPVVFFSSADEEVSDGAFEVQGREPRAFPVRSGDGLFLSRPSPRVVAACRAKEALALAASVSDHHPDDRRLPIVKHVPRSEYGDPPRT
jgi:hypothetical protein